MQETMKGESYSATIEVSGPPEHVFDCINRVSNWWSKDFEGSSSKLNDEFVIYHPGRHYSKQKLVELIPGKRVVWLVTESNLNWIEKDKEEWTRTRMIFDISTRSNGAVVDFTHDGLIPGKECYAMCRQGWDKVIKECLLKFINDGTSI